MKIDFFSHDIDGKSVIMVVDQHDVRFFGFVKANKALTPENKKIAEIFLNMLFQTWTENFEKFAKIKCDAEFRYESLKGLKIKAYRLMYKQAIAPEKMRMSITAVCVVPKKKKSFWLNTGSEMVYSSEKGEKVLNISSDKKMLNTFEKQNLFSTDRNYPENAEGMVVDKPKAFWIVSSEAKSVFESAMEKDTIKKEEFFAFSSGKSLPLIIGKVKAD